MWQRAPLLKKEKTVALLAKDSGAHGSPLPEFSPNIQQAFNR
jgi:hypothetical protein